MKKKKITKLVVDKFLTKKFRLSNQHNLSEWLKEITPEIHWITGEMAFYSYEKESNPSGDRIVYPFQLCIDKNNAKVEIAELDLYAYNPNVVPHEPQLLPYLPDKKILKVFKLDAIHKENLDSTESIISFLHPILIEYVEKKWNVKPK